MYITGLPAQSTLQNQRSTTVDTKDTEDKSCSCFGFWPPFLRDLVVILLIRFLDGTLITESWRLAREVRGWPTVFAASVHYLTM